MQTLLHFVLFMTYSVPTAVTKETAVALAENQVEQRSSKILVSLIKNVINSITELLFYERES